MSGKLDKFRKDPSAYVFIKLYEAGRDLNIFFSSLLTTAVARLKGVKMKGKPECWGKTYFMRLPNSEITVGEGCKFYSAFKSNNIGVFTRCRVTTLSQSAVIRIGDRVGMTSATVSAVKRIEIGSDTMIGANTLITDTDWHPLSPDNRGGEIEEAGAADVIIGKNVFIGTRAVILKGTVIGDNSVIGAGSVVSGHIPAGVIAVGNPCRVIRQL